MLERFGALTPSETYGALEFPPEDRHREKIAANPITFRSLEPWIGCGRQMIMR